MGIEDIISKYLSHSATEEEKKFLLQWLEEKEENREQFKKTYDVWLYSNSLLTDDAEMETAWVRLKEQIASPQKKDSNSHSIKLYFIRIAASILLLLSAGYMGYTLRERQEQPTITINKLLTGADGKGEYVLPDGSTVWLNANSVLEYPETFTKGKREVRLQGEALFEVKKDAKQPFFVHAGKLDVEVLGTRFLVNNYPGKPVVETVLVNGSIRLGGDYFLNNKVLTPGELMTYNKQTSQTDIRKVNTDDYTAWIHSKLVFDKTNLANVIINLEKWYGVEIVASEELVKNTHMSFTIRRESLEEVLKYMSITAMIEHQWKDDVLYLSSKN